MIILNLREAPYYADPRTEYYDKKYRKMIALPNRVLQAKEVTNLSYFPLYSLKDFSDIFYHNTQILDGMNFNEAYKIDYYNETLFKTDLINEIEEF